MLGRGGLWKYSLAPKRSLTSIHTGVCIACALNSAIAIACMSLHKSINNYASTSITKNICPHPTFPTTLMCVFPPVCTLPKTTSTAIPQSCLSAIWLNEDRRHEISAGSQTALKFKGQQYGNWRRVICKVDESAFKNGSRMRGKCNWYSLGVSGVCGRMVGWGGGGGQAALCVGFTWGL